eukprot:1124234-Rhodomonas_salina.3
MSENKACVERGDARSLTATASPSARPRARCGPELFEDGEALLEVFANALLDLRKLLLCAAVRSIASA